MTRPLTANCWVTAEVEATRRAPFKSRLRWLGRLRHRTVANVNRVGRSMANIAAYGARNLEIGITQHCGNDKGRRIVTEATGKTATAHSLWRMRQPRANCQTTDWPFSVPCIGEPFDLIPQPCPAGGEAC
jgi:hypothetical protein